MRKHILAASLLLVLSACSETNRDKIGEAQLCLDTATPATVNSCLSKISGIESANAYALRCSANFIAQGLGSASTLSEALNNLSGTGGTPALMTVLKFTAATNSEAAALAATAQSNCEKSGNSGMKLIAAMATTATTLSGLIPGTVDQAAIKSTIDDLSGRLSDPITSGAALQEVAAITNAIIAVYSTSCTSGTSQNTDICGKLPPELANIPPGTTVTPELAKSIIESLKN